MALGEGPAAGHTEKTEKQEHGKVGIQRSAGAKREHEGQGRHPHPLLPCRWLAAAVLFLLETSVAQPSRAYGPWRASEDLNEQHKAVLSFILSGDTGFWSQPAVAYRIGFGTAPWRCISDCQAQYYANTQQCAPDCSRQTYCIPGDPAFSDTRITCCALSLLDQSYSFGHPPNATVREWCNAYPSWGSAPRPSVCDFNVYAARGLSPPLGAQDPFLSVSCERMDTVTFYVNGTTYRSDTARRIIFRKDIKQTKVTRNNVKRISLRHVAAWHHPAVDITEPPQFALVDDLVCLPLEELYFEDVAFRDVFESLAVIPDLSGPGNSTFDLFNYTTWKCDPMNLTSMDLTLYGLNGTITPHLSNGTLPWSLLTMDCGLVRALVRRAFSSLNPNLALRDSAYRRCMFAPFTELNAIRWSGRARLDLNEDLRKALDSVKFGNQTLPRGWLPPAPDPVAPRPFLPDTLKTLTIKRTNDGSHPTKRWCGKPLIRGFLPAEWALLKNLEYLDLSDDMGEGLIEGPIPSTWLMMTKLRIINLTGHPNFCKDWHRLVSHYINDFCRYLFAIHQRQEISNFPSDLCGSADRRHYYGSGFLTPNGTADDPKTVWSVNVTVFDLDGLGWQWYDSTTGEAGYTNVIAPDSRCCWDTFSDYFKAHNYTITAPNNTTWKREYHYGSLYEAWDFCETHRPAWFGAAPKATGLRPPTFPATPKPPDIPSAPPLPPAALGVTRSTSTPRPPLFPPLPGNSPLLPNAPPQPPRKPRYPGKWAGAWSYRPELPPRPPPSPLPPPSTPRAPSRPSAPPIDCSLAAPQISFAIPNISRGAFFIAVLIPDGPDQYCMSCGCNLTYTVLDHGVSVLYALSQPASPASEPPPPPPPALSAAAARGPSPKSSNGASADDSTNGVLSDYSDGDTGYGGSSELTVSPIESISSYGLRRVMQQGSPSPTGSLSLPSLPALDTLLARGTSTAAGLNPGVLKDFNMTTAIGSGCDRQVWGGIAAAWRMEPATSGDYLFKIQIGKSVWFRWVVVDLAPPELYGQLLMSTSSVMLANPITASAGNTAPLRFLLAQITMSEPVQAFDLAAALGLTGGATLLSTECYGSATTAAAIAKQAAVRVMANVRAPPVAPPGGTAPARAPAGPPNSSTPPAGTSSKPPSDEASVGPPLGTLVRAPLGRLPVVAPAAGATRFKPPTPLDGGSVASAAGTSSPVGRQPPQTPPSALSGARVVDQSQLTGGIIDFAAMPNKPYVQSCLALMYAPEGGRVSVRLLEGTVVDLTGNPSRRALVLEAKMPTPPLGPTTDGSSRAAGAVLASFSLLSVLTSKLSMMQSSHHVQMLAMTANLASPGVSPSFRSLAQHVKWSVFSLKGSIPFLDKLIKSNDNVDAMDLATSTLRTDLKPMNRTQAELLLPAPSPPPRPRSPPRPPPRQFPPPQPRRSLVTVSDGGASLADRSAGAQSTPALEPSLLSEATTQRQLFSTPGAELMTAWRKMLISWLRAMSEVSNKAENLNVTSRYVIVGAAAGNDDMVAVDSNGQVLNGSSAGWKLAPTSANYKTPIFKIVVETQDLTYTVAAVTGAMSVLGFGHTIVNVLFRVFSNKKLPQKLQSLRAEVGVGGILIVGLTYFASLPLNNPSKKWVSALPLLLVVLPLLLFIWWLAVCRWYLVEKQPAPEETDQDSDMQPASAENLGKDAASGIGGVRQGGSAAREAARLAGPAGLQVGGPRHRKGPEDKGLDKSSVPGKRVETNSCRAELPTTHSPQKTIPRVNAAGTAARQQPNYNEHVDSWDVGRSKGATTRRHAEQQDEFYASSSPAERRSHQRQRAAVAVTSAAACTSASLVPDITSEATRSSAGLISRDNATYKKRKGPPAKPPPWRITGTNLQHQSQNARTARGASRQPKPDAPYPGTSKPYNPYNALRQYNPEAAYDDGSRQSDAVFPCRRRSTGSDVSELIQPDAALGQGSIQGVTRPHNCSQGGIRPSAAGPTWQKQSMYDIVQQQLGLQPPKTSSVSDLTRGRQQNRSVTPSRIPRTRKESEDGAVLPAGTVVRGGKPNYVQMEEDRDVKSVRGNVYFKKLPYYSRESSDSEGDSPHRRDWAKADRPDAAREWEREPSETSSIASAEEITPTLRAASPRSPRVSIVVTSSADAEKALPYAPSKRRDTGSSRFLAEDDEQRSGGQLSRGRSGWSSSAGPVAEGTEKHGSRRDEQQQQQQQRRWPNEQQESPPASRPSSVPNRGVAVPLPPGRSTRGMARMSNQQQQPHQQGNNSFSKGYSKDRSRSGGGSGSDSYSRNSNKIGSKNSYTVHYNTLATGQAMAGGNHLSPTSSSEQHTPAAGGKLERLSRALAAQQHQRQQQPQHSERIPASVFDRGRSSQRSQRRTSNNGGTRASATPTGTSASPPPALQRAGGTNFGRDQKAGELSPEAIALGIEDERLLAPYPGKTVPIYKLTYEPGSWPVRMRITPPVLFLARFEFMFMEGIGEGEQQDGRETRSIISAQPVNTAHKVLSAVVFGAFGKVQRSVTQIVLLILLQAAMVAYLVYFRPFGEWQRQVLETVCSGFELLIFCCAAALLNSNPDNKSKATYLMITCFFCVSLAIASFEISKLVALLREYWPKIRRLLQRRCGSRDKDEDTDGTDEADSTEGGRHGQSAASRDGVRTRGGEPRSRRGTEKEDEEEEKDGMKKKTKKKKKGKEEEENDAAGDFLGDVLGV